jgi:EmrB/QacA subfamily drug resistance transporter
MPELSQRRRMLILATCCMSLFIVGIDITIVNIALPTIRRVLHAGVDDLQWTVDAYTVVLATLLMLSGSLADRFGRRRIFQVGLVLFATGSLLCSLAPSAGWLIVFRMLQAVGGSMLNPVAMSIIVNVFTKPAERARALGLWAGTVGISLALGPVVGGLLLSSSLGWGSIFWINIPIALTALVLTALFVPESKAPRPRRADPVGQLLIMALFGSLTFGIIEAPELGWTSPGILACFALAVLALVAIASYEPRRTEPLLDLRFFASVPLVGALFMALATFAAMGAFLFVNTLYLQDVRGFSPLHAGLLTLPLAGMAVIAGPLSGRLVARRGPRIPLVLGGIALIACGVMLTHLSDGTSVYYLLAAYAICGFGFATINPPIGNVAMAGLPLSQSGIAGGLNSTSRQVGTTLGVAIAGSLIASGLHGPLRTGLAAASHSGWWIVAGYGFAVLVLGIATTGRRALRTATTTAARLDPERVAAATT